MDDPTIVGLGSSATFRRVAGEDDVSALADVIKTLIENGGSVFDTAPSYGASEAVSGRIAKEAGLTDKIFWATKVNVLGRGASGPANADAVYAMLERSFNRLGKDPIDLIQVHNLADLPTQMPVIQELKEQGLLAGKVVVEGPFGEPGAAADFCHASGLVAGLGKGLPGCFQDS